MSQNCKACGRTFRRQIVKSGNPENCPACNRQEHEMAMDLYRAFELGERIRQRKMLDSRDAVARRLKAGGGL